VSFTDKIPFLNFADLNDVPQEFSGSGKWVLVVTAGEDGLEYQPYVPAGAILDKLIAVSVPADNHVLVFNSATDKWELQDISTIPSVALVGAKAYINANETLLSAVNYKVHWDAVEWDTSTLWASGNPTRLTIPATGKYRFTSMIIWEVIIKDVYSETSLYKNGVRMIGSQSGFTFTKSKIGYRPATNQFTFEGMFTAGDYVELNIWIETEDGFDIDMLGSATASNASWMSVERIQ